MDRIALQFRQLSYYFLLQKSNNHIMFVMDAIQKQKVLQSTDLS